MNEYKLVNAHIYIRDIKSKATFFSSELNVERLDVQNMHYYFSEYDFFEEELLKPIESFLSAKTENLISQSFDNDRGVVYSQVYHLKVRLKKAVCNRIKSRFKRWRCKKRVEMKARHFVSLYYHKE